MRIRGIIGASMAALLSLGAPALAAATVPVRPARDTLTETYAGQRSRQVRDIAYDLSLHLDAARETYSGEVTARFAYKAGSGDVTIDYAGKTVQSVTVNGKAVPVSYNHAFLTLPAKSLAAANTVRIRFASAYDTTGAGLMRFVDPVDGKVYLYSDFEPFGAHRLFPCFDQPDLKARLTLRVEHPRDWVVVGNMPVAHQRDTATGRQSVFAATQPLSTYLYALHAGAYAVWHDQVGQTPMAIYARASLAPHVDAANLFAVTRQGLQFYGRYFDFAYPFPKYDQVFAPELGEGAMENPGAVTLNEDMIFRHQVTDQERFDRDSTILHEMAHMWFGDLVTMRWWNDLWLNESFATYMEGISKVAVPRYGDSWMAFHGFKQWAYRTDEKVTTHPIEAAIPTTEAALENFDGITYGKGAAVMKQLAFYIGPDRFRDGVRDYFKTHAWQNTSLADFMAALQHRTDKDLSEWTRQWLQTAGLNAVVPRWTARDGKLDTFLLLQSQVSGQDLLRPHRTTVGFLAPDAKGNLVVQRQLDVAYHGVNNSVSDAIGLPAPALVFANLGDQDYAKVLLDKASLETVRRDLSRIADPLTRQQVWTSVWAMVRDAQLDVPAYLELVQQHLPKETDPRIVGGELTNLRTAVFDYLAPEDRKALGPTIEAFAWRELLRQQADTDGQLLWAKAYLDLARSQAGLARQQALLTGKQTVPGLALNQDLRWQIIAHLSAAGLPGTEQLATAELKRDPSDLGHKAYDNALAARPQATVKTALWQRFLSDRRTSLGQLKPAMTGFHGFDQEALLDPYVARFFTAAVEVFRHRDATFAEAFGKNLYPAVVSPAALKAGEAFLQRRDLPRELRRLTQERTEELARTLKVRGLAKQALASRARPASATR